MPLGVRIAVVTSVVATLLLLTSTLQPAAEVLPALGLLLHQVKVAPAEASALLEVPANGAILVDGRRELAQSRGLTRLIRTTGVDIPLFLITTEAGWPPSRPTGASTTSCWNLPAHSVTSRRRLHTPIKFE